MQNTSFASKTVDDLASLEVRKIYRALPDEIRRKA